MSPFNVIMMRTYFTTNIPDEVIDAARVDGANEFKIIFGIVFPMADLPSTSVRMALTVMGILPVMIIYPFLQRYFVKGITIGAVKG